MNAEAEKRRALVTGASRGIGAAIFRRLAADGMHVCATATSQAGAEKIKETLAANDWEGSAAIYEAGAENSVAQLMEAAKPVDVLVCNAGITRDALALRMREQDWKEVLSVNLEAPFALARTCLRDMAKKRWGRVIMISSVLASTGNAGQANYCAAKSGLEGLTRALALEFASRSITVNAVAPGLIETDMTSRLMDSETGKQLLQMIPLGRPGAPDEIAAAVSFLASDRASYITGATIPVNGGMFMN